MRDLVESKIKRSNKEQGQDQTAQIIFLLMRELHMSFREILSLYTTQFYYLIDCLSKDIEEKNKAYKKSKLKHK